MNKQISFNFGWTKSRICWIFIGILLIILKLLGVIDLPWLIVLSIFLIPLAFVVFFATLVIGALYLKSGEVIIEKVSTEEVQKKSEVKSKKVKKEDDGEPKNTVRKTPKRTRKSSKVNKGEQSE